MDWIRLLDDATSDFARVLDEGDLSADVPACPGWTLADLGEHLRWTHLWAAHAVTDGNPHGDPAPGGLDRETLVPGYRKAAAHLLEVLATSAPDAPAWTFGPEQAAGFWRRRQVHETTMHLYDALSSQGRSDAWSIAPELAWDGVEEVASVFYPRQVRLGRTEPLPGTLRLVATDVEADPVVVGNAGPVATLEGQAAQVLLQVWKRAPVDDPTAAALVATRITP
ncbi:uncharacterized protein (TIGR03083 family) [Nocardioides thalensis]|uniref:Uncharacterized protein (TIGR03083 family) n=1 Tax=Nocardioides thalensis TaxID=1914755 RepID=A0A853C6P0_9ACTN|nr:maleylpyruvate isomerase family mycothiol-dependent enzyme [Nocardioides thalensis]NYJ02686.1 uncharacterized protein (TIGR03083 family) [Nocardioides thalensis]